MLKIIAIRILKEILLVDIQALDIILKYKNTYEETEIDYMKNKLNQDD